MGVQKAGLPADGAKGKMPPEERTCYICEKKGHLFRNCPTKVSPVTEAVNAPTKGDKASTCGTMGHHTKEAYLQIEVNGRCYNCLLDTGSDVTIFPLAVVKGRKLHPTSTNLKAANGTSKPFLGETTINTVWHSKAIRLSGVVTEHMDEVFLGLT